ncbi:hypothetical protein [Streptomyces tendae]
MGGLAQHRSRNLFPSHTHDVERQETGNQAARRLAIAGTSMLSCANSSTNGPIEVEAVRSYLNAGMEAGHTAVRSGQGKIPLPEETLDAYTEIDDQAYEPGTSHVLSALLACADAPGGLTGEVLYDVLSYCYEGVLEREDLPLVSLEEERRNARCIEAIDFQQRCIAQAQSA